MKPCCYACQGAILKVGGKKYCTECDAPVLQELFDGLVRETLPSVELAAENARLTSELDEAREDVLNALHVLEMYRTDTPEYKSMDVNVAVLWLKKAVAKLGKLEDKP